MWFLCGIVLPDVFYQFDSSSINVNCNVNTISSTSCFNFYSNSFLCENRSTVGKLSSLIVTRNEINSMLNTCYARDTVVRSGLGFVFVFPTAFSYRLINKHLHNAWFVVS